jgi:hypothetical protein
MNREEVIRLAKEAGLQPYYDAQSLAIERFAALVVEREREACAELAERMDFHSTLTGFLVSPDQIADAIRARGQ